MSWFEIGKPLPRHLVIGLGAVPFLLGLILYASLSYFRHIQDPDYKLLPNFQQLGRAVSQSFEVNPRTNNRNLLQDLKASLSRLLLALIQSVLFAFFLGTFMGAFPLFEALFLPFIKQASFVPPLVLLPLVFVFVGIGEGAKILLIFLGTVFNLTQDIYLKIKNTPHRLILKGYTLGASTMEVVFKVMVPFSWPDILHSIRLTLGQAWIYLIAAEMISANEGLGYRINVVIRMMGVNTILWYIFIIALMAFIMDRIILWWIAFFHPYYGKH